MQDMDDFMKDDVFLARWLDGSLTEEELARFKAHPDFAKFEEIANAATLLKIADIDEEANLKNIKTRQKQETKTIAKSPRLLRRVFIPAATILLLISAYFLFFNSPEVYLQTAFGEQKEHLLPDQSKVYLHTNSSIRYSKNNFLKDRIIELEGEAFFEVAAGEKFVVNTSQGQVKVLGTQFLVRSRRHNFLTACQSGRVEVSDQKNNRVQIKKGERVRINNQVLTQKENIDPLTINFWQKNSTAFESEPLANVVMALENQFGVKINIPPIKASEQFTGNFLHKDVALALKMVFTPMGLVFQKENDGTYTVQ